MGDKKKTNILVLEEIVKKDVFWVNFSIKFAKIKKKKKCELLKDFINECFLYSK